MVDSNEKLPADLLKGIMEAAADGSADPTANLGKALFKLGVEMERKKILADGSKQRAFVTIPDFSSIDDAEEFMKQRFAWIKYVDFKGTDPKCARQIIGALDELDDKYPAVCRMMTFISTLSDKTPDKSEPEILREAKKGIEWNEETVMASCCGGGDNAVFEWGIAMNPGFMKDALTCEAQAQVLEGMRALPTGCGTLEALTAYEFGIALLKYMFLAMPVKEQDEFQEAVAKHATTAMLMENAMDIQCPLGTGAFDGGVDFFTSAFAAAMYGDEESKAWPATKFVAEALVAHKDALSKKDIVMPKKAAKKAPAKEAPAKKAPAKKTSLKSGVAVKKSGSKKVKGA